MPDPQGFDFLGNARSPACMSTGLKKRLFKKAETKKNHEHGDKTVEPNIVFTARTLQAVFSKGIVVQVLRCHCQNCNTATRRTPPDEDDQLAGKISNSLSYQRLVVALAFMGATFAIRRLHEHTCDTIEKTLNCIPERRDLQDSLFEAFQIFWREEHCTHDRQHITSRHTDRLQCLQMQFVAQLRSSAWIVSVPHFQADNLLRRFSERQNMPFINEITLHIGGSDNARKFYKFMIHPDYCDEKLRGRHLFRKQLAMRSDKARQEINRESDILEYLKEVGNPNIAEVLFAFQEEYPPSFSLVFDYHPVDLRQILYPEGTSVAAFNPPEKPPNRFMGSRLDHWMWVGVLGVFDAVAAVHEPQRYTQAIPETPTTRFLGGHFDIKPGNIVIDRSGRFLLTDFGQAYFKKFKIGQEANFTIGVQTQNYIPPPSFSKLKVDGATDLEGKRLWTQEYDLWGLACVCIEVLAYIVEGDTAPKSFHEERVHEDSSGIASFWQTGDRGDRLKTCVKNRLADCKQQGDEYLSRVATQVEEMFNIQRQRPSSVKNYYQELSASVQVDRYLFKRRDDQEIACEGTHNCLKHMRTSFSTERVSQMRCNLYVWTNANRKTTALTLEFSGSDGQNMVTPGSTKTNNDELVPMSMFDTDLLFEANRLRTNEPFLQFAFRNLHDGVTFHFAKRRDFNHFFGAVTHQRVHTASQFRLRACTADASSTLSKKVYEATDAHLQIWEDLHPEDFAARFTRRTIPTIAGENVAMSTLPTPDDQLSTNTSPRSRGKRPAKDEVVFFRLVLYLRTTTDVAIIIISLNHDTFFERFDNNEACMILERRGSKRKILAATYVKPLPVAGQRIPADLSAPPQANDFPGVPLSNEVLSKHIENHPGLKRLELIFWGHGDLVRFRNYYQQLKK